MKKILILSVLFTLFVSITSPVFAAGPGGDCKNASGQADDNLCDGALYCDPSTFKCATDPSLDAAPSPTTQATPAHAAATSDFVPLTTLPGLTDAANAASLAPFLTQVYKICIGLAVVLAILQIMRAGVLYMGGDSVTEKSEARNLIAVSLAGLLLVLSPVIVFSIINPDILNLNPKFDSLKSSLGHNTLSTPNSMDANSNATVGTPSTIDSTGQVNAGCHLFASGAPLNMDGGSQQNSDEQCCSRQGPKDWVNWTPTIYPGETQERCVGTVITHSLSYESYYPSLAGISFLLPSQSVPSANAAYNLLKTTCTQINGKFVDKANDFIVTTLSFHTCPTNSGLTPEQQKTYSCTSWTATCSDKSN